MSNWFLGEIRLFSYIAAPNGWLPCDGRLLMIQQYQALYALLANQFGGNGQTNFAIPDLRGRVPLHFQGNIYPFAKPGGAEGVVLNMLQLPPHTHSVRVSSNAATVPFATGNYPATSQPDPAGNTAQLFAPATPTVLLQDGTVGTTGAAQPAPHDNIQPSRVLNFCISTTGLFPPRP